MGCFSHFTLPTHTLFSVFILPLCFQTEQQSGPEEGSQEKDFQSWNTGWAASGITTKDCSSGLEEVGEGCDSTHGRVTMSIPLPPCVLLTRGGGGGDGSGKRMLTRTPIKLKQKGGQFIWESAVYAAAWKFFFPFLEVGQYCTSLNFLFPFCSAALFENRVAE